MNYYGFFFILLIILKFGECARILAIFPVPSVSHQLTFQPLWKELSLRGHAVTVITPNPLNDTTLTNLTEIDTSSGYKNMERNGWPNKYYELNSLLRRLFFLHFMALDFMEEGMKCEFVQKLIKDVSVQFDVVLIQQSHNMNLLHGYMARFRAPTVAISSLSLFLHSHDIFGNPTHPVVSPDMMLNFSGELSFFDRVESLLFNFWYRIFYYWYAVPKADKIARKYFGDDMPYLGDLEKNISLMLVNVNPIIHTVRPNVPNIIEINQMHINAPKPLPKEIQDYLDSSTQGVVYFSLGSNVKSANLTNNLRNTIVDGLAELPYNVLWKWETDYLPNQPKNVMTRKWLPQQDILRHPNVKVFVTQGGLQSIEEAITFEVPMVGMPFITDQPSNVRRIVELGMGVEVDYKTLTKDNLKMAISEVYNNKRYKAEVSKARSILLDQPMKGVEKAVWWIEYVIRHKGAKHLRSSAADMSMFEYFMVDVVLFLLAVSVLVLYCLIKFLSLIRSMTNQVKKVKTS